ncbi:MAG: alanine--tRNA ligase [Bacteroidia bacterium]|jgi:alanyl-tRNA synthetase|nr:alanine--tRNA ligase [Bacteroidia bacterium]
MTAAEVRNTFLKFFESKGHTIVPSAPIVVKNDPTLMFTNAGMNQFKDWFLGNEPAKYKRVVDTQKCLRVSGKHNDLEEVGVDTYHHTMFEMLGNWSFGDYFKQEAIEWAWELLTEVYKLPKDRLYVTVFEGDAKEGLAFDQEAYDNWKKWIAEDRILNGNKKDNFWEMGDTGPCGPCTEIHIDLRPDAERTQVDGKTLVNNDHPQVIEIWNNVFMEFNRKADGSLEKLPAQHVDTGMGFERLVRAIEGKSSNYDTDVFVPTIQFIEKHSGVKYTFGDTKQDIAMRVMADHIRAICFTIADGQLPSNNGAGYVIRRILRRAVRYQYQFLNLKEPFLCKLAELIADSFQNVFPELHAQKEFVVKVIKEEEVSFLKTLEKGLQRIKEYINKLYFDFLVDYYKIGDAKSKYNYFITPIGDYFIYNIETLDGNVYTVNNLDLDSDLPSSHQLIIQRSFNKDAIVKSVGSLENSVDTHVWYSYGEELKNAKIERLFSKKFVFELYDTYGFPYDLTELISKEKGFDIDKTGFEEELQKQKARSRKATELTTDDWVVIAEEKPTLFLGYDATEAEIQIVKYRKVKAKGKESFQLVFNQTPFYPEGGGQVGDTGELRNANYELRIVDTKKENNLIIHFADTLPENLEGVFTAKVDTTKRKPTESNHSATHLLHAALRQVLGTHVQQKGSLVNDEYLRFDFSHFAAMTDEELAKVEHIVNQKIRENIALDERRNVPIAEAQTMGAMMLFGEKYGESVRVITFDETYSRELCGGTHVKATGQIGYFKITSEAAVAAGVRRIEAITGAAVEQLVNQQFALVNELKQLLTSKDVKKSVEQLLADKAELQKKLDVFENEKTGMVKQALKSKITSTPVYNVLIEQIEIASAEQLKNLSFQLKAEVENLVCVLGCELNGKPMLSIIISDNIVADKKLHAGNMVKELAKEIQGGGGGQPFYATAGGNNLAGLSNALAKATQLLAS